MRYISLAMLMAAAGAGLPAVWHSQESQSPATAPSAEALLTDGAFFSATFVKRLNQLVKTVLSMGGGAAVCCEELKGKERFPLEKFVAKYNAADSITEGTQREPRGSFTSVTIHKYGKVQLQLSAKDATRDVRWVCLEVP